MGTDINARHGERLSHPPRRVLKIEVKPELTQSLVSFHCEGMRQRVIR